MGGVLAGASVGAALVPELGGPPFFRRDAVAFGILAAMLAVSAWAAVSAFRGRWIRGLVAVCATVVLGNLFVVQSVGPVSNAYRSRAGFARAVAARMTPEDPLYMYGQPSFALPFYVGRPIPVLRDPAAVAAALVSRDAVFLVLDRRQERALRDAGFTVSPELERTWTPPGRPRSVRYLALDRVTRG